MCDIGFDGSDCSVWDETTRTARKEHRCNGCGALIRPGKRYLKLFAVFEGEATSEKSCLACAGALETFGAAHDGYPLPSAFERFLVECVAEGDSGDERWKPVLADLQARRAAA